MNTRGMSALLIFVVCVVFEAPHVHARVACKNLFQDFEPAVANLEYVSDKPTTDFVLDRARGAPQVPMSQLMFPWLSLHLPGAVGANLKLSLPQTQPVQLRPYLEKLLNSGRPSNLILRALQPLIDLSVKGQHRYYPQGTLASRRSDVSGVICGFAVPSSQPEGVFEMTLETYEGRKHFLFSASASPGFSALEVVGQMPQDLENFAKQAAQEFVHSYDILSVGIDTPPEVATYKNSLRKRGAIAFYGHRSPHYEFSNFYAAPITIDGVVWPTTEHYFQALKFMQFVETPNGTKLVATEHVEAVRSARSPGSAAAMGRDRSRPLRPDWEEVKVDIMYTALYAKFTQYKRLYTTLMSTGDAYLVEHTERDHYWGDAENGTGKNMLGILLMRLRTHFRTNPFTFKSE